MINYINVICTDQSGSICENKLFIGSKRAITKAELCFTKKVKELNKGVSKDLLEEALDNGYYQSFGTTVFITHPDIRK